MTEVLTGNQNEAAEYVATLNSIKATDSALQLDAFSSIGRAALHPDAVGACLSALSHGTESPSLSNRF